MISASDSTRAQSWARAVAVAYSVILILAWTRPTIAQTALRPDTVAIRSGRLTLRGVLWRPAGSGPFPGVLFNHGSSSAADPTSIQAPATLGPVFARHGYVFLFLFRQGIGLSRGQGTADGDVMNRAFAADGMRGRNRVQLQLLEGEELNEVLAGLAFLRALPTVDPKRVAVVGHSFGGSLTLVLAARDTTIRAAVAFGPAAASWEQSPDLRAQLFAAVDKAHTPLMFIHAANDYSVVPGKVLAAEMERLHREHVLKIYGKIGTTAREGHSLIYLNVPAWERDVFRFLDTHLRE